MSPIPLAATPFPTVRDNADFMNFTSTVDHKQSKRADMEGRGSDNDNEDEELEDRERLRVAQYGSRSPADDDYDVSSCGQEFKSKIPSNRNQFNANCEKMAGVGKEGKTSRTENSRNLLTAEGIRTSSGVEKTLSILTVCTNAYQLLCTFRCREVRTVYLACSAIKRLSPMSS
jgi:hypothetical protein